jgi:predicted transcriptional regulator
LKGTLGASPWNLPTKTSSVLLLDGSGTLVYRYSGRMGDEDQKAFFQALGGLLGREISEESHP